MVPKVLFISVNRNSFPYPVYPLGLCHLASTVGRMGYQTNICDMQTDDIDLPGVINSVDPDFIGLSLRNIDNVDAAEPAYYVPDLVDAVKKVREASTAPVILGGSGYSLFPGEMLEMTGADFGICGEGEIALPHLLENLVAQRPYDSIPGLVHKHNARIVINPKDGCPVDAISPVQRPRGLATYYIERSSMLNIQTQRGCAYSCCYCTYPVIEGRTFRRRDPEVVCDEIAEAVHLGARYVFIVDSVFNTSEEHVAGICEEILRRELKVQWGCFLRPKGISRSLMALMARAGLTHVEFGTDSLCDSVLEAYGKQFTVADVIHASECARQAKVKYAHFLIIGGPAETGDTIRQALANSKRIKKSVFFPCIGMRVYPDTPLYTVALQEGVVSPNADLVEPYFYISPHLSREEVVGLLQQHSVYMPNWIVGKLDPSLQKIMHNLIRVGVVGPRWEFLVR